MEAGRGYKKSVLPRLIGQHGGGKEEEWQTESLC